jgi:NAD(P)H-nitrite reductase large subunit
VVILTQDGGEDYPKPRLSHGFGQQVTADQLVVQTASRIAATSKVMVRPHTRVTAIDFDQQTVIAGDLKIPYGDLVLAVGAKPFVPPFSGTGADEVLTLNSLTEYRRYFDCLNASKHVLVIGGGLIGTEIAQDIAQHRQVTMVDINERLLARLVPEQVSRRLQAAMHHVRFRFNRSVAAIHKEGAALQVELSDGERIAVDSVVCAAGLKPRLDLATGLATQRGILVDTQLRTSRAHVYALGDCAEIDGKVLPYLQPIMLSAQALAKTLTGEPTAVAFGPMPVAVKTPLLPIQVGGETDGSHLEWQVSEDEQGLSAKALYQERLVGYVAAGSHNGFTLMRDLISAATAQA